MIELKQKVVNLFLKHKTFFSMLKNHHANTYVIVKPPYTPLLYSKIGVYRGIPYFLIFALKHRLCVHVRTASHVYPQSIFRAKIKKKPTIFHLKIDIFTAEKIVVNCIGVLA